MGYKRERERLLASVAGSSGPSVFNFIVNFTSKNRRVQRAFKREGQLAADKGIGRLTLAVKYESGESGVVDSVIK